MRRPLLLSKRLIRRDSADFSQPEEREESKSSKRASFCRWSERREKIEVVSAAKRGHLLTVRSVAYGRPECQLAVKFTETPY